MGGNIGVSQYGENHTARKAQASDDSESPAHAGLIDSLAVEDLCIEATELLICISIPEPEADDGVEIGNLVGNPCKSIQSQPPLGPAHYPRRRGAYDRPGIIESASWGISLNGEVGKRNSDAFTGHNPATL